MSFGDSRDEFYEKRRWIADEEDAKLRAAFGDTSKVVWGQTRVRCRRDLETVDRQIRDHEVAGIVFHLPIWASPNLVTTIAARYDLPIAIVSNTRKDSSATSAYFATAGAMDKIDRQCFRYFGDLSSKAFIEDIAQFITAAQIKGQLKKQTFGAFGMLPLGIEQTIFNPAQWKRLFGLNTEIIDQYEIVKEAKKIGQEQCNLAMQWITQNYGHIDYNDQLLTVESLDRQIRSYLAVRNIIQEHGLDFVGIKCQPELSDGYAIQCLTVSLLNDPYDMDGHHDPIVCACETDADGALTMQILKLASAGLPTTLMDVRHPGEKQIICANCGSLPSWYTKRSSNCSDNLHHVHLIGHVFGQAGGAALQMIAGDGEVTLARLCQKGDRYWMTIMKGYTRHQKREKLAEMTWSFPAAFIDVQYDREAFTQKFAANHLHMVAGNVVGTVEKWCKLNNIAIERFKN